MPPDTKKPKPRGRPRREPWPEPIPDDPENIMRIIMRTPASEIRDQRGPVGEKPKRQDRDQA